MHSTWSFRSAENGRLDVERTAMSLGVTPRLVRLMLHRKITSPDDMQAYLSPSLKKLAPLETRYGVIAAAELIAAAVAEGKRVAVWGDYDVDGVSSTALLKEFFAAKDIEILHKLPHREHDGYGVNVRGVEELAEAGAGVLITVDCGITDVGAVRRAKELGMTVVVTDHHLPGEEMPSADAVCNPRLCDLPEDVPAGVGVVFMLAAALNAELPGERVDIRQYLDFVALGMVADIVKLTGQNRILVKNGLLLIKDTKRPGIAALKEVAGYKRTAPLGAGQVGFGLAPRINAAGRLDVADTALELLTTGDGEKARLLAGKLDALNSRRRKLEDDIFAEASEQAAEQAERQGLVLFAPHWHGGVIGIVASRIVEKFYKPTLVLTEENGALKGSGRSISLFNIFEGISACAEHLTRFGGHRMAAGLGLAPDKLDAFREDFDKAVRAQLGDDPICPSLDVDEELPFHEVTHTLLKELDLMQPFGPGNPEPVFTSVPVRVKDHSIFGKKHVRLKLTDETNGTPGITFSAKAWRMAESMPQDLKGSLIRIAFTPKLDCWDGIPSIDLRVRDWKPAEE